MSQKMRDDPDNYPDEKSDIAKMNRENFLRISSETKQELEKCNFDKNVLHRFEMEKEFWSKRK